MRIEDSPESEVPRLEAPAHDFRPTEAKQGRASTRIIQEIVDSMSTIGWSGPPISVVEINSEKYIINGHHRVIAARIANILVQYRVITDAELLHYDYDSTDQVIQAHAEAGPNRIRLR